MKKIYDLVVIGAGPSGMTTAISAARQGLEVLLIDKNSYPGGMNTAAMVSPLLTFHCGEQQVIKGIAQEIIDRLAKHNATLGHIPDPIGMASSITPIDTEILKIVYFEMLEELPNITVLFDTVLYSVESSQGIVKKVCVINKSGSATYTGKMFVDSTGDGDLAAMAKAEFNIGRTKDGLCQPMTLIFTVGGVDLSKVIEYVENNTEQFILNKNSDLNKYLAVSGFFEFVKQAQENGDLNIPRDRVLFFQGIHPGEITVNMTRIIKLSGINAKDLSITQFEAHKQIMEIIEFFKKYIDGFQSCYIQKIANTTGVRESRRIKGKETLTIDNVIQNLESNESIAICSYPIDIHDPNGMELNWLRKERACCYDIPFGVMVPIKFDNLLVTGRCISATHEAIASARISATAMAIGEAAGVAASVCAKGDYNFNTINMQEVQTVLNQQGAIPGKKWL